MNDDAKTKRPSTPNTRRIVPIPQDAYSSPGDVIAGEPGMPEQNNTLQRERARYQASPRTGVGTPDEFAEAGGAELGGDSGDVGTPRNEIEHTLGGTAGTSGEPNSTATGSDGPTRRVA